MAVALRWPRQAATGEEERRTTAKVVAHAVGREGARRQRGRGGGELGQPAIADTAARGVTARESKEGRVREAW